MIEAVNSVISNAPFSRIDAEKISATRNDALTSASESAQADGVNSIKTTFDTEFGAPVTQILDPQSGQVLLQFPSETRLENRESSQAADSVDASDVSQDVANEQQTVTTSFDVFDATHSVPYEQTSSGNPEVQLAVNALNEAAQSGLAAVSTLSVQV